MSYDIQRLLDNPDVMGRVNIPAGEYEGRFTVRKSCTINGGGSVLWGAAGPVLIIEAENVVVNDLKMELTHDSIPDEQHISVYCCHPDTRFGNVEVNGAVLGIPGEEQYWGIPKMLSLGKLAAERQETFEMEIYSPVEAELKCEIHDISLSRNFLAAGSNTVSLTVGRIRSGSLLHGNILLVSAAGITRKIYVTGSMTGEDAPSPENYLLYSADREAPEKYKKMIDQLDISRITAMPEPVRETEEMSIKLEEINEYKSSPEPEPREEVIEIFTAKRVPLAPVQYRIEFGYTLSRAKPDIDGYLFMLKDNGRVADNTGMIFFGNDHSPCGSVRYLNAPDKRAMFVDLDSVPSYINHMIMFFSIYGNDPSLLFDAVEDGEISILSVNGVRMRLRLEKHMCCRTILACGFERTDGVWELVPAGKAIAMPMAEICKSYGVTVS
ncbi:MAG: TerD family protein [Oscillospiraceae bacterium]|nr:TerD family protein [Oscillospiraceae bacterium]